MKPALFLHVAAPLVRFRPVEIDRFPHNWTVGRYLGAMSLFGLLPLGQQSIVISFPDSEPGTKVLRDAGGSRLLPVWDHRIEVTGTGNGTIYTDRVTFDAGWLSPFVLPSIKLFFRHRQKRLRRLATDRFSALKD